MLNYPPWKASLLETRCNSKSSPPGNPSKYTTEMGGGVGITEKNGLNTKEETHWCAVNEVLNECMNTVLDNFTNCIKINYFQMTTYNELSFVTAIHSGMRASVARLVYDKLIRHHVILSPQKSAHRKGKGRRAERQTSKPTGKKTITKKAKWQNGKMAK